MRRKLNDNGYAIKRKCIQTHLITVISSLFMRGSYDCKSLQWNYSRAITLFYLVSFLVCSIKFTLQQPKQCTQDLVWVAT